MTVLDDVADLIRRIAPAAACDDCIGQELNLESSRHHANHKTLELQKDPRYRRARGECVYCKSSHKLVIRVA